MLAWLTGRRSKSAKAEIIFDGSLPEMPAEPCLPISGRTTLVGREAGRARQLQGRIWLCLSVFVLIFSGLALRLANITLVSPEPEKVMVASRAIAEPGERPEITDRNGVSLALNRTVTGLAIDTKMVWDAMETAQGIASVFPQYDPSALARRIEDKKYIILRNELTAEEQRALLTLGLPGVTFPETTKRVYPQGALAAHAAGYTIAGRGGVAGLEFVADEHAGEGKLASSIDVRAQQILEEEIRAGMDRFKVDSAWGVIMKAKTGEVVALASMPSFNPNEVNDSPADHWRNRAMQDRYELGSAFKVITAASVIEEGIASPETLYDARKPLKVYDRTIYDFHPRREIMSLSKVVQHSSNIGIARAALDLGRERQREYFAQLGLTEAVKTELPESRDPDLPLRWGPVETATISYGHGIAVTPLQLTAAISAVINGGIYRTPTFLKVEDQTGASREGRQVFSPETSAKMRLIMRQVITDGSASRAEAPGYYPIGKTATADKPGIGGYRDNARLSSFVGAFPGYDPEYVILVSFDEPHGIEATYGYATAGWVAAPVFGNIVARMGPVLGIAPAHDDLAFAQFMAGLRSSEEVTLALNDQIDVSATASLEVGEEMDDVARLLAKELGP
ncbi:penicillin-binding protein 2 [Parvularcula flava]|uniref:Penicillin-binding protein 2 n=1 Tax=Aquisalinus luteolus TaxID=1566827 RepID=A0A8J3A621_9PROT|nr:penicillin-binding protein 2 [Aquisalinus luteolus]NHK29041.1 penicillin-binding protein 2 [Aquisalinus luteolus]GGI00492.1 peptidoglycan synthase FtsI [Aquisalinus luteolus]